MNSLGDRMKQNYEYPSRYKLIKRMPVIVRVDGRAFHTFTKKANCVKPFDFYLSRSMEQAAKSVAEEMQGFCGAYVQSDEVSFLLVDYQTHDTQAWFDYVKSKVETITASLMTAAFNRLFEHQHLAHFDARAFNIPVDEVSNYFLWRIQDWHRNSISMFCRDYFSHKDMYGKSIYDMHEMLYSKGVNWATDVDSRFRNGTWITEHLDSLHDNMKSHSTIEKVLDRHIRVVPFA